MARKSAAKRIDRLEQVAIGAGFLLRNLYANFGDHFSLGLDQQVRQCINDCNQIERARLQRESTQEATHA